jgi:drug/metabolite transporter (DMT)-like permease
MVFAQKTIQIGTIGIAQVAQPALAVVWSFLLLGEVVNHRQTAGIAIVVSGLLAFVVLNQRGDRTRRIDEEREKVIASQGSGVAV